ncbi:MAG: HAMP domain-containing histidine kinase [Muribaculaceae bacterium]|nr:HAMP domain-containing histidine kinase [Muribaculaceae bacterium]
MKKSTIWLLTIIMAIVFAALLYMQIMYMESMIKMREDQFSEGVRRGLHSVAMKLQQDEIKYYLEEDVSFIETSSVISQYGDDDLRHLGGVKYRFTTASGLDADLTIKADMSKISQLQNDSRDFARRYRAMQQDAYKDRVMYKRGLINDVMLNIMSQTADRPIRERVDSATTTQYLKTEFANNGIDIPFEYALVNRDNVPVFRTSGYMSTPDAQGSMFVVSLFRNDTPDKAHFIKVYFPRKSDYIHKSLGFMVPVLIMTIILLIIFIYIIVVAFRQKKLTEMKNDFINNMTHEFKTPISTISLAAQMLNDDSVRKSPAMLQHAASIINDETKRLRFQVEKVLQMSMFDKKKATVRLQEIDANSVIYNIINTFKLKVERYGGTIRSNLDAEDAIVMVDEMHFTNVIFNLLDNAVKYRREDVPLQLMVTTRDIDNKKLEITVSDNGIGIKREDLKKIFERFYRVHTGNVHDVKGFGLGLAYVKKMIEVLGGEIKAESEINVGTKFIIILPLTKN